MAFGFACLLSLLLSSGQAFAVEQPPLVRVYFSPDSPKVGDVVTAFIEVNTTYSSPAPVGVSLSATFDGQAVSLLHPVSTAPVGATASQLWIAQVGPYTLPGSHTLQVVTNVFDLQSTNEINFKIFQLNSADVTLQQSIAVEKDPVKKAQLQAQLDQDNYLLSQLAAQLLTLMKAIGTDSFSLTISPSSTQAQFY